MPAAKEANDNEPQRMTWAKAAPIFAITGTFDLARLFFTLFWFFGPVLAGTATAAYLNQYMGSWLSETIGTLVAGASGVYLSAALGIFGTVMAMVLGFMGALVSLSAILATNARIFKVNARAVLWMVLGFGITQTPFIGGLPSLTVTAWRLYHHQIKAEKAAHQAWQQARDAAEQEKRVARETHITQRHAQRAEEQAVRGANDNEIPEHGRMAA
jgi:hypothetical protein